MITTIDTKDPRAVEELVAGKYKAMFPRGRIGHLARLFADTTRLFTGGHPDFLENNLKYHDYEHTLQATVCMTYLLEGRHAAAVLPRLTARQFVLAISSALLHDCGYLKINSDTKGTGAKYTFVHVLRSCAYAASYLPRIGANEFEIEGVLAAISCTGPTSNIAELSFHNPIERTIGCVLSTSDYLGQMAAVDYADELEFLFAEFDESYDFFHTPKEKRPFESAEDLQRRTPLFWRNIVLPKLENEYQAVYRFLARPGPHGTNLYLESVERNIAKIKRRLRSTSAKKL